METAELKQQGFELALLSMIRKREAWAKNRHDYQAAL